MRSAIIIALTALLASPAGAFVDPGKFDLLGVISIGGLKEAASMPEAPPSECPDAFGKPTSPGVLCGDGLDEWHRNYFNRESDQ